SGLAAIDCVMRLLKPGDEVVAMDDLYGGTFRLFTKFYEPIGIKFTFVDMNQPEEISRYINENTKLIWVETPTNPLMKLADIERIAQITKEMNVLFAVDNTFATPYLQKPLELGADMVMHSATKYLGGHSDVVGGLVATRSDELAERLRFHQNAAGAVPSPFDCFLVMRGMRTLAVRMERASANASALAGWLADRPEVSAIHYPGLP